MIEDVVSVKGVGQFGDEARVHHQRAPKFWQSRGGIAQRSAVQGGARPLHGFVPNWRSTKPLGQEKDIRDIAATQSVVERNISS